VRIRYVEGIGWSGGQIDTYVVVNDGPLEEQSIVPAPTPFLIHMAQIGRQKNSIRASANDLAGFFEALQTYGQDWRKLTDRDMSGYLYGYLRVAKSCTKETIERNVSTLRSFYANAWETGFLENPPTFTYTYVTGAEKVQGYGKRKIDFDLFNNYIEASIFEHLLSNVKTQSPFEKERDETVLYLGYHLGLRNEEVTDSRNLRTDVLTQLISDAEKTGNLTITVPIYGKGNKLRQIDVPPKAFLKIKSFLVGRRRGIAVGPLICKKDGGTLYTGHATDLFKAAKIAASLSIDSVLAELYEKCPHLHFVTKRSFENLSFHALRHTYATNLVDFCYKHGYDPWQYVPEQMGHEDKATTKEYVLFDGKLHRREKIRQSLNDDFNDD
jgi:site-specific recombinase XerD